MRRRNRKASYQESGRYLTLSIVRETRNQQLPVQSHLKNTENSITRTPIAKSKYLSTMTQEFGNFENLSSNSGREIKKFNIKMISRSRKDKKKASILRNSLNFSAQDAANPTVFANIK